MKKLSYILLFCCSSFICFSQNRNLKRANKYFERTFYTEAIPLFEKAIKEEESFDAIKNLADSYYFLNNMEKASVNYKYLLKNYKKLVLEEYYIKYANTLKAKGKLKLAYKILQRYYKENNPEKFTKLAQEIDYLENIQAIGQRFAIENLGLNTNESEFEIDFNKIDNDTGNEFTFLANSPANNYEEFVDDHRSNTIINLDYVAPITKNTTLELGVESRTNKVENTYKTDRIDFRNSDFTFDRNIYSFYTTVSQQFNNWKYNIGVRLENYEAKNQFSEVGVECSIFSDHQFTIYPSGFLKYTPNENTNNSYVLSFSRRVDRPSLNQINPIRQISTPQIFITGNPNLVPQFTNSIELNYSRKLGRGTVTFGSFYRRINDEINRRGYFDDENPTVLIIDYDNFDSTNAYGLEFTANYKLNNWWRLNGSIDAYFRKQKE